LRAEFIKRFGGSMNGTDFCALNIHFDTIQARQI
jgi:hypothetical protein